MSNGTELYTAPLGHYNGTVPVDLVVATTPAVGRVVLRDISGIFAGATPGTLTVYWSSGSDSATLVREAVSDAKSFHWDGRQVIPPSSSIHIAFGGSGSGSCSLTGYIFST